MHEARVRYAEPKALRPLDYHSLQLKALGAYHIAHGTVTDLSENSILITVTSAWQGDLDHGLIQVATNQVRPGQAQEFKNLKAGDEVVTFVFCRDIPGDLRFTVFFGSPRRALPVKFTEEFRQETASLIVDLYKVKTLREAHGNVPNRVAGD